MKPVKLVIAGLNSYRQEQTIDFETLCDGGVFGIFGPTGSGKSTILDAITLALYGKVERAANNTQGIMNHAENQLFVSFTFDLEDGQTKKRYTVERTFKRVDNIKVNTRVCRLLEIGNETVVLADKASEVNEKLFELLGLTIDDFTRAVVLPQGKFAEFLSLKGSERRKMFERLFNLEQYGETLGKKLKNRLQKARQQLAEISAEQAGLGNASKEALREAEETFQRTDAELKEKEKQFEEITKEFEQAQTIWSWQTEKKLYEEKQRELEKEKDRFLELEKKLEKADQAEQLKPYAEALLERKQEKERFEQEIMHWQQKEAALAKLYKESQEAFEAMRAKKSVEEPTLLTKREQYKQFIALEAEIQEDKKSLTAVRFDYENLKTSLNAKEEQLEKTRELLKRAVDKQNALKLKIKEETVAREDREKIQKAIQHQQQFLQIVKEQKDALYNKKKKETQLEAVKEKINKAVQRKNVAGKHLAACFVQLQNLYHLVCDRMREHEFFAEALKADLQKAQKQMENERIQQAAFYLSQQLADGEPCPVCGSTNHPAPSVHVSSERLKASAKKIEELNEVLEKCQQVEQLFFPLKQQLEQLSEDLLAEHSFLNGIHETAAATSEPLMKDLTDVQQAQSMFQTEWKALQQDYLEIKETIRKTVFEFRDAKQMAAQVAPMLEEGEKELIEINETLEKIERALQEEENRWNASYPELEMDKMDEYVRQISEKDAMVEQLQERIEKSVEFIQEKEQEVEKLRQETLALSNQMAAKKGEMDRLSEQLMAKQKRLKQQVKTDGNLFNELKQIEEDLESLKREEQSAYERFQQAQADYQRVESKLHTAKEQLKEAEKRFEKAEIQWNERMRPSTIFSNVKEVMDAMLPENEKQTIKGDLETYKKETESVASAIEQLDRKLAGRMLEEEKWKDIQKRKEEAWKIVNEAREKKGAAYQQLEVLLVKHQRYMELEEKKRERELLLERLEKLQTVLKGNSFVEYLAEEQLEQISFDASVRLGELTRQRYAIEVESEGGFIMRDDANGGVKRPVSTLSGGETFLTSLALALSLSAQIQLHGKYPLQFFFLDEGFGTLDAELLDTVVSALEKLQSQNLSVGVISHVQELRERLPKRLIIEPAEPSGKGTTVRMETI